jgi:hypothetical protein
LKKNPIEPGELVNRKTCPWYLDDLEEQCAKFRGFLSFAAGDGKAAMEQWNRIPKLDSTNSDAGTLATNPNDYQRLKFGAEHGYLVAYPQELDLYDPQQKFVVQLGDFYYVTQQFDKSVELCQRMLKGDRIIGRLSSAQQDYPRYVVGMNLAYRHSVDAGLTSLFDVLERRDGTLTEYRAALAIGQMARGSSSVETIKRGWALLEETAASPENNEFVHTARVQLARDYMIYFDRKNDAIRLLRSVPQSSVKYEWAQFWLHEYSQTKGQ